MVNSSDVRIQHKIGSAPNQGLILYATVHNIGEINASNVTVNFFIGYSILKMDFLGRSNINLITPDNNVTTFIDVENSQMQRYYHLWYIVVDPLNNITEENELNNDAILDTLLSTPPRPDLVLFEDDVLLSNKYPKEGETIGLHMIVYNIGSVDAYDILVEIYIDGILTASENISHISVDWQKNFENISISWEAMKGVHIIDIKIITHGSIDEITETNNQVSLIINVNERDKDVDVLQTLLIYLVAVMLFVGVVIGIILLRRR